MTQEIYIDGFEIYRRHFLTVLKKKYKNFVESILLVWIFSSMGIILTGMYFSQHPNLIWTAQINFSLVMVVFLILGQFIFIPKWFHIEACFQLREG